MTRGSLQLLVGSVITPLALVLSACDTAPTGPEALQAQQSRAQLSTQARPFHGTTAGHLVGQALAPEGRCPAGLPLLFTYHGEGEATHMGRIAVDGGECVFADPSDPAALRSGAGAFTFTAANGDRLMVTYTATTLTFSAASPWVLWSAPIELQGGTGRFARAALLGVVWHGGANMVTGETWSALDGAIIY